MPYFESVGILAWKALAWFFPLLLFLLLDALHLAEKIKYAWLRKIVEIVLSRWTKALLLVGLIYSVVMVFHEERMRANNAEVEVRQGESEINSLQEILGKNESDNQRLRDELADAREAKAIELKFPEGAVVSVPTEQTPWGLTNDQLTILTLRMDEFAETDERAGFITSVMNDPKSEKFAMDLVIAFRDAGWILPGSGLNRAMYSGYVEGVVIQLGSTDVNKVPGLLEFVKTLHEAGIELMAEFNGNVATDEFRIIVGHKP